MSPRFGLPFWLARPSAKRRPVHPRHHGHLEVDVAIAGGGLTGCTIAYLFAAAGVRVALLEAKRIGSGSTASSAGALLHEPDADFQLISAAYGLRAARRIWQASRRAALEFAATLRRLKVRCDLQVRDAIRVAITPDQERQLRRDYQARSAAGLEVTWINPAVLRRETGVAARAGLRSPANGELDPFRACLGLAAAATKHRAQIFERSPVRRIRPGRKAVEIATAGGTLRADTVVVATGYPTGQFRPLHRHFRQLHAYAVVTESLPAPMRRTVGRRDAVLRDMATPPHLVRWMRDDRILVTGADQPAVADRARPRTLVQRANQLMYELSLLYPDISGLPPAWSWDIPYARSVDGLACIGPHRNYPRHLFALGYGKGGDGLAYLAGRILLRHYLGELDKGDELFLFARLPR